MRTPQTCAHRKPVEQSTTSPGQPGGHFCALAGEIAGVTDQRELAIAEEFCAACCKANEPSTNELNPLVASKVFMLTHRMLEGELPPTTDEAELRRQNEWAQSNLTSLCPKPERERRIPAYGKRCVYLGNKLGERDCPSCKGNVRLKVFACQHQSHEEATIRDCQVCSDYEPRLELENAVSKWAVGVTTAPRREPTIGRSLDSLITAGWSEFNVFAEPDCDVPDLPKGCNLVRRSSKFGAWPNFLLGLSELILADPDADAYFMAQDDTVYCSGLRSYLEASLWPDEKVGVVSLHAASHQTKEDENGFFQEDVGWGAWGAQAYVFPNSSARALLRDPGVVNHRQRGMGEGRQNVDSVVGDWCRRAGFPYFLHSPSLSQHIGNTSAIWSEKATTAGRRRASDFVGEETDIRTEMRKRASG